VGYFENLRMSRSMASGSQQPLREVEDLVALGGG